MKMAIVFENSAGMGFLALGFNGINILGARKERSWTILY
jgi:hypothetical protein